MEAGLDLDLSAEAPLEPVYGIRVRRERQPIADEHVRVDHAGGEQLGGAFVAVEHGHGPGDRDLLVVDLVRLDDGTGGVVRDPALQTRSALADAAEPVLDRFGITRGIDDALPAAGPVELVRGP